MKGRVLAGASIAFGLMWLAAAALKIASPLEPYELVTHVVPSGTVSVAVLAAAVALEVALGVAMVTRAAQGFALTLAGLTLASLVLWAVRLSASELVPCGCFGDFLGTTLDGALIRNGVLCAVLVALIVWSRRRARAV